MENLIASYRVGSHQIRRGRRAGRPSTSQGSAEPLCVRESKARTGRFLREKLISDHGLFSSYEGQLGEANEQDSWSIFREYTGLWTAGCWLAHRFHQLKASVTRNRGIFQILLLLCVALRNLGLLISKTDWSVICPLCC